MIFVRFIQGIFVCGKQKNNMLISYEWLQSYFPEPLPKPEEVAKLLTFHAFEIEGIELLNSGTTPKTVKVNADGKSFDAIVRIDTPGEADYYRHGGIMQYVLRSLLK